MDFLHANSDAETKELSMLDSWSGSRNYSESWLPHSMSLFPSTFCNCLFLLFHKQPPHAPIKAMMFDFQTLRYASPMIDLATFLANSTGTDVRSTHFSFIFKTYHEEVIKTMMFTMKKFRQEIPEAYRYEQVESDESF